MEKFNEKSALNTKIFEFNQKKNTGRKVKKQIIKL